MYRRVLAFDFDGTLAAEGKILPELRLALERLGRQGFALFLATGRQYDTVPPEQWADLFGGVAWENGALLTVDGQDELYLPFGHIDPRLVKGLEAANVPLEYGVAIVATQTKFEETVWRVLAETGSDAVVVRNKGALMLLPPGTSKGTGLERLLELCGFSTRNLISFGDGENDLALFQVSETGVAVADAVPGLRAAANYVADQPGPAGVLSVLHRFWLDNEMHGPSTEQISQRERRIALGKDDRGELVTISGAQLICANLGIFGDSGSGKSWVTGLLAEGMHLAGYQVLLIDPEGDFRGLHSLPGIISISGSQHELPAPNILVTLLAESSISVVLDLCSYPVAEREPYLVSLFKALRPLKDHKFRPHWIVLEEAQSFLPPKGNALCETILPVLGRGGWAFVSFRPDRLAEPVTAAVDRCLVARTSDPDAARAVCRMNDVVADIALAEIPKGHVLLCDSRLVHLRPAGRRVPHIRHLYKYLDMPLPRHKRFQFHDGTVYLGLEAANLYEFKELIPRLPAASLEYHLRRGDFAAWVSGALDDDVLASHLEKLAHRKVLTGEALRRALLDRVTDRYQEIHG